MSSRWKYNTDTNHVQVMLSPRLEKLEEMKVTYWINQTD